MSDREFLEFAAKAVGNDDVFAYNDHFLHARADDYHRWNPLTDDGDALRLVVKLKLNVICNSSGTVTVRAGKNPDVSEVFIQLPTADDPYAATRRAITEAAAAIGKAGTTDRRE